MDGIRRSGVVDSALDLQVQPGAPRRQPAGQGPIDTADIGLRLGRRAAGECGHGQDDGLGKLFLGVADAQFEAQGKFPLT
jgi:hypothetical protein